MPFLGSVLPYLVSSKSPPKCLLLSAAFPNATPTAPNPCMCYQSTLERLRFLHLLHLVVSVCFSLYPKCELLKGQGCCIPFISGPQPRPQIRKEMSVEYKVGRNRANVALTRGKPGFQGSIRNSSARTSTVFDRALLLGLSGDSEESM